MFSNFVGGTKLSYFGTISCLVNTCIHGELCHVVPAFFDCVPTLGCEC